MGKTAKNDITRDKIKTKPPTDKYRDGWERIFKQKKKEHAEKLKKRANGTSA